MKKECWLDSTLKPYPRPKKQRMTGNPEEEKYVLKLYVTGMSAASIKAIENIKIIVENHLKDRCDLEIIDIYIHPGITESQQLVACPTLIKESPLPRKRLIGDLSDRSKVLAGLGILQTP